MTQTNTAAKKPLVARVTPEQYRLISEAAAREHRSVSSYVVNTLMKASEAPTDRPKRSPEEVQAIIAAVQDTFRKANPTNRDIVAELIAERRAEAASE